MKRYQELEVDIDKLLGVPIEDAIAFLEGLKKQYSDNSNVRLFQKWEDFENNYFVIVFS